MLLRREKCGDNNVEHWKTFQRFLLIIFKERSRSTHSRKEALPLRQLISVKFFYHWTQINCSLSILNQCVMLPSPIIQNTDGVQKMDMFIKKHTSKCLFTLMWLSFWSNILINIQMFLIKPLIWKIKLSKTSKIMTSMQSHGASLEAEKLFNQPLLTIKLSNSGRTKLWPPLLTSGLLFTKLKLTKTVKKQVIKNLSISLSNAKKHSIWSISLTITLSMVL